MKKVISILSLFAVSAILSLSAFAQNTNRIDRREHKQQKSIRQGVRSGELTWRELARLEREQFKLRRQEHRAKADGVVTFRERWKLHKNLNEARRDIYRAKHNRRDR